MSIDLDALERSIRDGEAKNIFVAPVVKDLVAELRDARKERPAAVAYLRTTQPTYLWCALLDAADAIERGDHLEKT